MGRFKRESGKSTGKKEKGKGNVRTEGKENKKKTWWKKGTCAAKRKSRKKR